MKRYLTPESATLIDVKSVDNTLAKNISANDLDGQSEDEQCKSYDPRIILSSPEKDAKKATDSSKDINANSTTKN